MPPGEMATEAEAAEMISHMMRTKDPKKRGGGMAWTTNTESKIPYRNQERAYHVLRIGSLPSRKRARMLSWAQFQRHVNKLLEVVSPHGCRGKRRRERIQATRKVLKAFMTVTGVRLTRSADDMEQETKLLAVTTLAQPLSRVGLVPEMLIYKDHPPMETKASAAHRNRTTERKELTQALREGLGEEASALNISVSEQSRHKDLWKYQATHQFVAAVRSSRPAPGWRGFLYENVTLSAVATPHDATSLWTALSYCVSGHFEHAMTIKASIYGFFHEVMNKGSGHECSRHSRYRLYQHLQRSSIISISAEEREDWGQMSLFRSLAVNDPGAGPPGFTRFEEVFWVIADFFGTEVVVFTPMPRAEAGLEPVDGYTLYDTKVYGQSPGLDGWPCRPSPLTGTLHHPWRPRFFNAKHQVLLVTDEDRRYVMPVRKAPMEHGLGAGDDPSIDANLYDDEDRWFRWGTPEKPLLRPPNVWLLHTAVAGEAGPLASIDPGAFLPWLPACDLDVRQAATRRHGIAKQMQPAGNWPAPKELWDTFEARIDAPQMARIPEADAVMDAWNRWTDPPGTFVAPLGVARYMQRDGPWPRGRFKHDAQARLLRGMREAYVQGWTVPEDPLNGRFSLRLTDADGVVTLKDDDDVEEEV